MTISVFNIDAFLYECVRFLSQPATTHYICWVLSEMNPLSRYAVLLNNCQTDVAARRQVG